MTLSVGVVGAGIVGLSVARRLARWDHEVTVFEKEADVALHQTGHNSGVVHAGVYYPPGSLKSRLCRDGARRLKEFCAEHHLPYEEIGKVIVARSADEAGRLRDLEARARAAGVPGLRRLDPAELAEVEPHVRGYAALHSPTTAIVDYRLIARALADDVRAAGGRILLGRAVTALERAGGRLIVHTAAESTPVDRLVICAGLQSDRVAALAGDEPAPAIVPFRGEYHRLAPHRRELVKGLVYPVPDPAYPFLGVHFTPRVDGTVDIGPNAVLATAREGYRRGDVDLADLREVLRWPGFRRLARAHWRAGVREALTSLSTRRFIAEARAYVPELTVRDVIPAPAGVRAQAVDRDGALVDDFAIHHLGPVVSVRNAPSPAATSALAIADHIAEQVRARARD
ncbi:L-2-hydroxyglutarate oxidase [Actinoallomurus soli]|uniref:L-2-hydroxyglutarate oxidase n=1 Tax=Actinoallomurus soli TaxID=2952535 RepID=UPI0020931509|nr:L-2-hydroxyglutarate oxidase [Actinoallomurus soli]MCO5972285.1 L-2-hydroxyglutarate oxidase [Actinoallomurus soli]